MFLKNLFKRSKFKSSGNRFAGLEKNIGYRFQDSSLVVKALRHRSALQKDNLEPVDANETLEFLGDAVLGLVTAEYLFHKLPCENEGKMTQLKSLAVSGHVLSICATEIDLGKYLLLGSGEAKNGGRSRPTILEDAFEALVGAIYLDGGLKYAARFIHDCLLTKLPKFLENEDLNNYKSQLLEWAQANISDQPYYHVIEESGPDHDKTFTVEVSLTNQSKGKGRGQSKKLAEQRAARSALKNMGVRVEDSLLDFFLPDN